MILFGDTSVDVAMLCVAMLCVAMLSDAMFCDTVVCGRAASPTLHSH